MLVSKKILWATASIALLGSWEGQAAGYMEGYKTMGYQPSYVSRLTPEQKGEWRLYMANEQREPCQNYLPPPDGFYRDGCILMYRYPEPVAPVRLADAETLISYQIYFDFDSIVLDQEAEQTIMRIANDIERYNPHIVAVRGFTDSVGTEAYNDILSQDRIQSVSWLLNQNGISNQILDEIFYGESNQAIATKNDIPLRANRRVQVDFLK